MKIKALAAVLMFSTTVVGVPSFAQDFVPAGETSLKTEQGAPIMVADAGVQAVADAGANPYVQGVAEEFVSAEEQLQTYMDQRGWSGEWDPTKKRMFVVAAESFDVEDPSYDTDFIAKRSMYATLASMSAKAQVIEFMRTQMSATDQLTAPGTDVHEQLNTQYRQLSAKITRQQEQLIKLLREVDAAEADKLAGVSWQDLSKEGLAAAIKKLDSSFDAGQIEEKKRKVYEKAKARYQEARDGLAELEKEAQAIRGEVKLEATSSVETLAKAPLMGATLLAQAESWDAEEEEYQVAVLLVWSEKLEQAASTILSGNPVKAKPRQGKSIGEWARGQDLSTMVGSRQFIDDQGSRWYVGAYGSLLDGSSSAKRAAKGRADLYAKKELAVALFADLETQKQAQTALQTRNAGLGEKDHTAVAESFAESTRQSIENRQISGASKILSKTVRHPVSGHKLYVSLYAISADSAANAIAAEARSYAKAIDAAKNNAYQQGLKHGYDQQMDTARNDQASFNKGVSDSTSVVASQSRASEKVTIQTSTSEVHRARGQSTGSQTVFSVPDLHDDDF